MRKTGLFSLVAIGVLCLSACGGGAATPPTSGASTSAPAGTASQPAVAGQADWDSIVAAAKKEGKVAMFGAQGADRQASLTEPFTKKYGISVDYLPSGGPEVTPRVQSERGASKYLWDLFVIGTSTGILGLRPLGAVDPIEPDLILPEVKDVNNWRGGKLPFVDKDNTGLAILRQSGQYFYINTKLAKVEDFTSWRNLLDPKWAGKLLIGRDPLLAGYGRAMFDFFYMQPQLGPDFIRDLLKQNPVMFRDDAAAAKALVDGLYPMCFCSDIEVGRMMSNGLPVDQVDPRKMKEGTHATSAYANVFPANKAPHPNAAKVYINWLLSQEGGASFSKAAGVPSLRTDVSTEGIDPRLIPDPSWPVTNLEDGLALETDKVLPLLHQLLDNK
ncbi:MAG TPA: extracellular solute-binding protein [Chloroflexota bacterium]|nr:extracellular solute-binding protein [Chloroflexota bacterium]